MALTSHPYTHRPMYLVVCLIAMRGKTNIRAKMIAFCDEMSVYLLSAWRKPISVAAEAASTRQTTTFPTMKFFQQFFFSPILLSTSRARIAHMLWQRIHSLNEFTHTKNMRKMK